MNSSVVPTSNPFCTRCVRPGAIPFVFPAGKHLADLITALRKQGWRGEIVGPHGSGKSTLLATLVPELEGAGRTVIHYALHDGQRSLPVAWRKLPPANASTVVVIDGYEQLSRWNRLRLARWCRRRAAGLLVTTHASLGMPTLFTTATTLETAQQLASELLSSGDRAIAGEDVAAQFRLHAGNLREVFFGLYDLYEARRASSPSSVTR
jgi:hypothetical protein